jgi:antitoxin component of MazEF toxin-antitoxin module
MKRKLVKQGKNVLTVSLPSDWVKKNCLEAGDEVDMEIENEGKIGVFVSKKKTEGKTKIVNILHEQNHQMLPIYNYYRTIASSAYREGYNKIVLNFERKMPSKRIYEIVSSLYGFEVDEETDTTCTLKSLITENDDPEKVIKKMFQTTSLLHQLYEDYYEGKKIDERFVDSLKQRQLKLRDYSQRCLFETSYLKGEYVEMMNISFLLEKYHASMIYMLNVFMKGKVTITKKTYELIKKNIDFFNDLNKLFSKKDLNEIHRVHMELRVMMKNDYHSGKYIEMLKDKEINPEYMAIYYYHVQLIFSISSRVYGLNS